MARFVDAAALPAGAPPPRPAGGRRPAPHAFALGLFLAAGCGKASGEETSWRTEAVVRRDVTRVVEVKGQLEVAARAEVPAPFAGRLVEVAVTSGDTVEEGQVLGRLDPQDRALALASARAQVAAASSGVAEALANLRAADGERARAERLAERDLASDAELAEAVARAERARASVAAARAERTLARNDLALAERALGRAALRAPMDGVVLRAPDRAGVGVDPAGPPPFAIGDRLDTMAIRARVSEVDVGEVAPGQAARFTVPAHGPRAFEAEVVRVGLEPVQSPDGVVYPVWLQAANPEGALRPGMTAAITIGVGSVEGVLAVREAALRFVPEGADPAPLRTRLWREGAAGRLEPVPVSPGLSDGAYTEIEVAAGATLAEGDRVVVGVGAGGDGRGGAAGLRLGGR